MRLLQAKFFTTKASEMLSRSVKDLICGSGFVVTVETDPEYSPTDYDLERFVRYSAKWVDDNCKGRVIHCDGYLFFELQEDMALYLVAMP